MTLDDMDKRLLNLVQAEFPLAGEPFAALGLQLGMDAIEVIHRIENLKADGIVRYIGPLFDAGSLGYQSTLVAMRVAEHRLNGAAQVIVEHPGISHGYQREHHLNLWLTLALPSGRDMDREARRLSGFMSAEEVFNLPALKLFKLRAYFDATGGSMPEPNTAAARGVASDQSPDLMPMDRAVINELQQDLPLVARPFDSMSERLGVDTVEFLACCQALLRRGVMHRYSASVTHTSLGLAGNAMVCWVAPSDMVEAAGQRLAALSEVSHCYERRSDPLWPYNLYAMIHGRTREDCRETAREVSHRCGLTDYVMLFSSREIKKTRVKYLV